MTIVQGSVSEVASVKSYGAKGDGVADDTAAIQAAFDTPGDTVYFPEGHYKITSPIIYKASIKLVYGMGGNAFNSEGSTTTTNFGTFIDGQLPDSGILEPFFIFQLDTTTVDTNPTHPSTQIWRDFSMGDSRHNRVTDPYGETTTVGGWRNYAIGAFGEPTRVGPKDIPTDVWSSPSAYVFDEYNLFENISFFGLKFGQAYEGYGHTYINCHSRACLIHYDFVHPEQGQMFGCTLNYGRIGIRSNVRKGSYAKNFQFIGGFIQRMGDNNSSNPGGGDPSDDGCGMWFFATETTVNTYFERNDSDVFGGDLLDVTNTSKGLKKSSLSGQGTPFATALITSNGKSANINLLASTGVQVNMAWTKGGADENVYLVYANDSTSGIEVTYSGAFAETSSASKFNLGGPASSIVLTAIGQSTMFPNSVNKFDTAGVNFNAIATGDAETIESKLGMFRPGTSASLIPFNFGIVAYEADVGVMFNDSHNFCISTTSSVDPSNTDDATRLIIGFPNGDLRWELVQTGPIIKSPDGSKFRIEVNNGGTLSAVSIP